MRYGKIIFITLYLIASACILGDVLDVCNTLLQTRSILIVATLFLGVLSLLVLGYSVGGLPFKKKEKGVSPYSIRLYGIKVTDGIISMDYLGAYPTVETAKCATDNYPHRYIVGTGPHGYFIQEKKEVKKQL